MKSIKTDLVEGMVVLFNIYSHKTGKLSWTKVQIVKIDEKRITYRRYSDADILSTEEETQMYIGLDQPMIAFFIDDEGHFYG